MFGKLFNRWLDKKTVQGASSPLDVAKIIPLDSEDLAEQGIADAYERLLPLLREFVRSPVAVVDLVNDSNGAYSVQVGDDIRMVYSSTMPGSEAESWGRATYVFFQLVNEQLQSSPVRFYALYGGNDLGGIFLTPAEAESACVRIPRKRDWPYLPTSEAPLYGSFE